MSPASEMAPETQMASELASTPMVEVRGAERRLVPPAPLKLVQLLSGFLLLRWAVVLAARHLLGSRVETQLQYRGERLHLHSERWLLGRRIREEDTVILAADLVSVGVQKTAPQLLLLLGALGTLAGAIVGIGWVLDGIDAAYVTITLVGLGTLAAGILLDIVLGSLADLIGQRVSLLITVRNGQLGFGRRFCIGRVDEGAARRLMRRLAA